MSLAPRSSVVRRVAFGSALAASVGGLVAAVAAGVTARRLVDRHQEAELRAALHEVANELDEALSGAEDKAPSRPRAQHDDLPKDMDKRLRHELDDLHGRATVASLRRGDELLAGDTGDTALAAGHCREIELGAMPHRLCATDFHGAVLTVGEPLRGERERQSLLLQALLIGLACGALFGGAGSYFISTWALIPLTTLRDQIRQVHPDWPVPRLLAQPAAETEIEELRVAMVALLARLGAALGHARSFAAEAAHELRTPLTTIGGELELISERGDGAEVEPINRVRAQVGRLVDLVQRLLVLAQPDDLATAQGEVIDLSDIVFGSIETLPGQAARIRTQIEEDVLLGGDPTLLQAMIVNAVENALKFSDGPVTVCIGTRQGSVRIEISDEGPGLSEEDRERVFEPFYRAANTRADGTPGHGLGLALIARVARVHGGHARFDAVSHGARLVIELPGWRGAVSGTGSFVV